MGSVFDVENPIWNQTLTGQFGLSEEQSQVTIHLYFRYAFLPDSTWYYDEFVWGVPEWKSG